MRTCKVCNTSKKLEDYGSTPAGPNRRLICKACDYQRVLARKNADPEKHKIYHRYAVLKNKYGITQEHYEKLVSEQKGLCKICNQPEASGRWLSVDHCHNSMEIRGLLCHRCNTAIGMFNENVDALASAIKYLEAG